MAINSAQGMVIYEAFELCNDFFNEYVNLKNNLSGDDVRHRMGLLIGRIFDVFKLRFVPVVKGSYSIDVLKYKKKIKEYTWVYYFSRVDRGNGIEGYLFDGDNYGINNIDGDNYGINNIKEMFSKINEIFVFCADLFNVSDFSYFNHPNDALPVNLSKYIK